MIPGEGAPLLEVVLFCCPTCPVPKSPPGVLLSCAWPKPQPDPPVGLFVPPPNRLLPPPPLPKRELPPAVLVLPNGFAAEDVEELAFAPKIPPAGIEAVVFV